MAREGHLLAPPRRAQDYHDLAGRYGYRYRSLEIGATAPEGGDPVSGFVDIEEPQPGLIVSRTDVVQRWCIGRPRRGWRRSAPS